VKLLVTGGAGFIGSNLIRKLLRERASVHIVNLDLLTYAGDLENLDGVMADSRHTFVKGDICDEGLVRDLVDGVDAILNLAAESHVDRSIQDPAPFLRTNVLGVRTLMDAARAAGVRRFVQVSTDEVYGQLQSGGERDGEKARVRFHEESPLRPRSPYSASKAGADLMALSYFTTFGMDVVIPRGSNNYGPRQHREKLIPKMALKVLAGEPLPLYGDGLHVRDWIHVDDFCGGILAALDRGRSGAIYNFGSGEEHTNLQVVRDVVSALGVSEHLIRFVADRPGHDRRYSMDCTRAMTELGWSPAESYETGLPGTLDWYRIRSEGDPA
jgi:dTDP-glucose 4,6-dehydratase